MMFGGLPSSSRIVAIVLLLMAVVFACRAGTAVETLLDSTQTVSPEGVSEDLHPGQVGNDEDDAEQCDVPAEPVVAASKADVQPTPVVSGSKTNVPPDTQMSPVEPEAIATAGYDFVVIDWYPLEVGPINGYRVFRWRIGSDEIMIVDSGPGEISIVDSDGIKPETEYRYWVFPLLDGRLGNPTHPITITTLPAELPEPPVVTRIVVSPESVGISWSQMKDSGVTGFRILRRDVTAARAWSTHVHLLKKPSHWEVRDNSGLQYIDQDSITPGHEYEYRVCSIAKAGIGPASDIVDAKVPEAMWIPAPENVTAYVTFNSIALKWDTVDHPAVTGYQMLFRDKNEGDEFRHPDRVNGRLRNAYTSGKIFRPLTEYEYKVRAVTPLWSSSDSPSGSILTLPMPSHAEDPPLPPTDIIAVPSHAAVMLNWDPVDDPTISGYRVFRKEVDSDVKHQRHEYWNWVDIDSDAHDSAYLTTKGPEWMDIHAVKPDTKYEYRIAAVNSKGEGEWSDPVLVVTESVDLDEHLRPATPFNLQAEPTAYGITLTWDVPDDPSITGYTVVTILIDGDTIGIVHHDISNLVRSFDVPYLTPNEESEFQVQGVNDFGQSYPSERILAKTMGTIEARVGPQPRHNYSYHSIDEVHFNLTSVFARPPWRYRVTRKELSIDGFSTDVEFWESSNSGYTDDDVKRSTLYWYEFVAIDGDSESEPLHVIVVTPKE